MTDLCKLKDKHRGEVVFVIGGGPQLGKLSSRTLKWLENQTTIGCNQTIYYLKTTYWTTAHIIWAAFYHYHEAEMNGCVPIFMNPHSKEMTQPWMTEINFWTEFPFVTDEEIQKDNEKLLPTPELGPMRTETIKLIQLAVYIGAKKIICIGMEMNSFEHCYTNDEKRIVILKKDAIRAKGEFQFIPADDFIGVERTVLPNSAQLPFNRVDGGSSVPFMKREAKYLDMVLKKRGIKLVCAAKKSALIDAGIKYEEIEELKED